MFIPLAPSVLSANAASPDERNWSMMKKNSTETVDSVVFNMYFCCHISHQLFVEVCNRKSR